MAAKRPEGVGPTGLGLFCFEEVGALRGATPSVAFGDISPSRGEIIPRYTNPRLAIIASGDGILPRNAV